MNSRLNNFKIDINLLRTHDSDQLKFKRNLIQEVIKLYKFLILIDSKYFKYDVSVCCERLYSSRLDLLFSRINDCEMKIVDKQLVRNIKKLFRNHMKQILSKSNFLKRGFLKPKGYSGDFKMLEGMYNKISTSKKMGRFLDYYYINNNYVEAVRERKDYAKNFLQRYLIKTDKKAVRILNLACGACREIRELNVSNLNLRKNVCIDLIDQDSETLEFAKSRMRRMPFKTNFVKADILNFFKSNKRKYDLIYSIGVADYLPDSYLSIMFRDAYRCLNKNGMLIVAHKNVKKFPAPAPDWFCDWKFIPRDRKDVKSLVLKYLHDLKEDCIKISGLGLVFYIKITK